MTPDQLAARAQRAKVALDEFVQPAIDAARAEYMEALTKVAASEPWASDKIVKLAIARNVIDMVAAHMGALIAHGDVVGRQMEQSRKIAELPHAKRRWI